MGSWDFDYLVIGSGLAGLSFALKAGETAKVAVVAKATIEDTNSSMAQGGIAAVTGPGDSFESHIEDTLTAGAGLCQKDTVKNIVYQAPERIEDLKKWGVKFDHVRHDLTVEFDLTREGGHSQRRILHVADQTGLAIQTALLQQVRQHPNISLLEGHIAVDLLTNHGLWPSRPGPIRCLGAYVMDQASGRVEARTAPCVVLATGGAGKVYLYTSNWSGATGDGIAMAYRAGARVANLEFMQFHPTCLYHPEARNFLISEALRGEGGQLVDKQGQPFMSRYHHLANLAPRDIVARAMDNEMKRSGDPCVFLDMTHLPADEVTRRFPAINRKCLELGIDMTKTPIPVVPAAHYLCGGVLTNVFGQTDIEGLFAIGETGCNGLHGANRLASNSLLECLATAHNAFEKARLNPTPESPGIVPHWPNQNRPNADELIVISHMWDEVRRLMWNYVGIVRSNRRLQRAASRLRTILEEVHNEDNTFRSHSDLVELRNLSLVAYLTVLCAQLRQESRGIHYSLDYPNLLDEAEDSILNPGAP